MTEQQGWVSIHRRMQEKGWYTDSHYVHLWVHIIMKCNHAGTEILWNGGIQKIHRGQFVTGRKALSEETGISQSKIERILKCFESEQQIEQQKTTKFRLITVKNYEKYQSRGQQSEQQMDNKRTTNGQQVDTNNNDNNVNNDNKLFSSKKIKGKPYGDYDRFQMNDGTIAIMEWGIWKDEKNKSIIQRDYYKECPPNNK